VAGHDLGIGVDVEMAVFCVFFGHAPSIAAPVERTA